MGQPRPLFVYFCSFQTHIYRKTVDVSKIRSQIVVVEGEHADHLTTTTALYFVHFRIVKLWRMSFITFAPGQNMILFSSKAKRN